MSDYSSKSQYEEAPPTSIEGYEMNVDYEDLPALYRSLLDKMMYDVTLTAMGLEMIANKKPGAARFKILRPPRANDGKLPDSYLPMKNLVAWIHFNTILIAFTHPDKKSKIYTDGDSIKGITLEESMFPTAVEVLGRTVGLHGLNRILLSLLHNFRSGRVDKFASLIEQYLKAREGEDTGFKQLPSEQLIEEVLEQVE